MEWKNDDIAPGRFGTKSPVMVSPSPPVAARRLNGVATVGFLVAMIDGYDTLMLAFTAPLIAKDWALLPQTIGQIFASTYAGAAVGATLIGIGADRYGRRWMLFAALALMGLFTMLCALSENPLQLMALRSLAGLGLGGALSTATALTASNAPIQQRRATVTRMFLGFPIGAILGGAVTAKIMTYIGWRGVFIGGGVCALLLVPLVAAAVTESRASAPQVHSLHPLAELRAERRTWITALFCGCVFLMLLTSYFLVSWIPTVLTLNGLSPERAAMAAVVLNCGGVAGSLALSFVVGRTTPLAPVIVCLCAGAVLIALLGPSITTPQRTSFILVFAVGLLIIGAQGGIPALCVYLYPPSVYATAVGLSVACGRLGSILGPLIGGYLISARLGWNRLFLFAALPAISAAVTMTGLAAAGRRSRKGTEK
jgi:AAHS family 4-hydroxybenzoate transporter-like MFS transporter